MIDCHLFAENRRAYPGRLHVHVHIFKKLRDFPMELVVPMYFKKPEFFALLFLAQQAKYELCAFLPQRRITFRNAKCGVFLIQSGNVVQNYDGVLHLAPCEWRYAASNNRQYVREEWERFVRQGAVLRNLNPFNRKQDFFMCVYIAHEIISKSNCSFFVDGRNYASIWPELRVRMFLSAFPETVVVTKKIGIQFLTCYTDKFLSFEFYLAPFDGAIWINLILFLIVIIALFSTYRKYDGSQFNHVAGWLPLFAILFDDSSSVPGQLEKSQFYRIIFGFWGLVAVLLTNCYSSSIVTELNAPLPGERITLWENLLCDEDIVNFRNYSGIRGLEHAEWVNLLKKSKEN